MSQAEQANDEPEWMRKYPEFDWIGYVTGKMQRGGSSQYLIIPSAILEMWKVDVGDNLLIPLGWLNHPPTGRPPLWKETPLRKMGVTSAGFLIRKKYLDMLNLPEGEEIQIPVFYLRRTDDPHGDRLKEALEKAGVYT